MRCGVASCLAASPSSRHATAGECPSSIASLEGRIDSLVLWKEFAMTWMSMKATSMLFIIFLTCFTFLATVTKIFSTVGIFAWCQIKKEIIVKAFLSVSIASASVLFGFTQSIMLARCSIFEPNRRRDPYGLQAVEGSSNRRSTGLKSRSGSKLAPIGLN